MTEKLKNCPFCGGEATIKDESDFNQSAPDGVGYEWVFVGCDNNNCVVDSCSYSGRYEGGKEEAIKVWNTRHNDQSWQPIETAPKDGTEVLLYFPEVSFKTWLDCEQHVVQGYYLNGFWTDYIYDPFDEVYQPTNWMPLPDAPKTEPAN